MLAALNLLDEIANSEHRCVAVLGDMLELGEYEEEGHRVVGGRAAEVLTPTAHTSGAEADKGAHHASAEAAARVHERARGKLITVGPRGHWIADEALADGMDAADVYAVDNNERRLGLAAGPDPAGRHCPDQGLPRTGNGEHRRCTCSRLQE